MEIQIDHEPDPHHHSYCHSLCHFYRPQTLPSVQAGNQPDSFQWLQLQLFRLRKLLPE